MPMMEGITSAHGDPRIPRPGFREWYDVASLVGYKMNRGCINNEVQGEVLSLTSASRAHFRQIKQKCPRQTAVRIRFCRTVAVVGWC